MRVATPARGVYKKRVIQPIGEWRRSSRLELKRQEIEQLFMTGELSNGCSSGSEEDGGPEAGGSGDSPMSDNSHDASTLPVKQRRRALQCERGSTAQVSAGQDSQLAEVLGDSGLVLHRGRQLKTESASSSASPTPVGCARKRGRGRPRKYPRSETETALPTAAVAVNSPADVLELAAGSGAESVGDTSAVQAASSGQPWASCSPVPVKRGRGRPRKVRPGMKTAEAATTEALLASAVGSVESEPTAVAVAMSVDETASSQNLVAGSTAVTMGESSSLEHHVAAGGTAVMADSLKGFYAATVQPGDPLPGLTSGVTPQHLSAVPQSLQNLVSAGGGGAAFLASAADTADPTEFYGSAVQMGDTGGVGEFYTSVLPSGGSVQTDDAGSRRRPLQLSLSPPPVPAGCVAPQPSGVLMLPLYSSVPLAGGEPSQPSPLMIVQPQQLANLPFNLRPPTQPTTHSLPLLTPNPPPALQQTDSAAANNSEPAQQ